MKRSFLVVVPLLTALCWGQQPRSDRQSLGYKGRVQHVEITELSGDDIKPQRRGEFWFDENGKLIKERIFDDYGYEIGVQTNQYDASGTLSEQTLLDPKNVTLDKTTYIYRDGKLSRATSIGGSEKIDAAYEYDAAGKVSRESYTVNAKPAGITKYKYTQASQEVRFFLSNGKPGIAMVGPSLGAQRVMTKTDASGHTTDVEFFELDGSLKQNRHYKYGDDGEVTEMTSTSAYGTSRFVYVYQSDSNGNWSKQNIDKYDSDNHTGKPDYSRTVTRRIEYFQ